MSKYNKWSKIVNSMELIVLKNAMMEVTLCDLGASIFRLLYNKQDMLVSPSTLEDFSKKELYFGKTIGRICGRVKNEKGQIVLHGGKNGLSNQKFDFINEDNKVIFTYLSKGDESSLKGEARIKVTYTLLNNELRIDLEASSLERPVISLTNHSYFCLGESNHSGLNLQMDSDRYFVYDESLFPVGTDDISKKYNFKEECPVMKYGEIDTYFTLNKGLVTLKSKKYQLEVLTDYEGTVVYTDNFEDNAKTFSSEQHKYRGVAIEPQCDSFNRKPLEPGKPLKRFITYRFKKL